MSLTEPNLHYTQADVDALLKRATELVIEVEHLTAERDGIRDALREALKLANGTTERRTAQLHEECDRAERLRIERDAARAEVEQLRAEVSRD